MAPTISSARVLRAGPGLAGVPPLTALRPAPGASRTGLSIREWLTEAKAASGATELRQSALASAEENVRRPWDTGPILGLARNAAARTVRSVIGRPAERVTESA